MDKSFTYNGKTHKVFPIHAFGANHNVIVDTVRYSQDESLALVVLKVSNDNSRIDVAPWGVLTVNMSSSLADSTHAFVKSYSENEEWADDLAKQIGGKKTNISKQAGFCTVSLWDFSNLVI